VRGCCCRERARHVLALEENRNQKSHHGVDEVPMNITLETKIDDLEEVLLLADTGRSKHIKVPRSALRKILIDYNRMTQKLSDAGVKIDG
jgi:hypothetical protein